MNDQPESEAIDTSDRPETDDTRGWVEWRTRKLRSGSPYWQPIANQLRAHGLDPDTLVLADIWPDDPSMEAVVVVTADGRVFEFEYRWSGKSRAEGALKLWKEHTASWRVDVYPKEAVAVALQILREGGYRDLIADQRTNSGELRSHVIDETRLFRSDSVNWRPLAACIAERGVDLMHAGLGSIYSEREGRAVNFVVTADGTIFQYELRSSTSTSWALTEWVEIESTSLLDQHEQDLIDAALALAKAS